MAVKGTKIQESKLGQERAKKAKKRKQQERKSRAILGLPVIEADTAGIDIGATEIYVAVPVDRVEEPVRSFPSFTVDLRRIAEWLKQCKIRRVAMESTGVYWIPLYQVLADEGFEVCLVNARHYKNVPGKKTDVADCQWLQFLHSVGLLRGSHRPEQAICALRTLLRHRYGMIEMAAQHVQHIQKSLEQMNLKLAHVISDIMGVTGMAIIEAIVKGERDPKVLAALRDLRVQASEETIMKSLEGDYRQEHLITLKQSLELYRDYQQKISELDRDMEAFMIRMPDKVDIKQYPMPKSKKKNRKRQHNAPEFDLRSHCYRMFGVDLTEIPGMDAVTAQVILTEVGTEFSAFPSAGEFASWLRLCPWNRITGGQVLSGRSRKGKNRAAIALRLAAQTLHGSKTALGDFFRQMKAKLGPPKAITAAAHKLARIIYAMVTQGRAYDEGLQAELDSKQQQKRLQRLHRQAKEFGCALVPLASA